MTSDLQAQRHTAAHILAAAVQKHYPHAQFGVGPPTEHGFYYDIKFPEPISVNALATLEETMREIINRDLPLERSDMDLEEAISYFSSRNQPFKVSLLEDLKAHGTTNLAAIEQNAPAEGASSVSLYTLGEFVDLCHGGHVERTGEIDPQALKLDAVSGVYFRGDETNEQLQRVYGLLYSSKKELKQFLNRREEARKRDHRVLGEHLDLFTFSDLVGPGLPLWTPKGTALRNAIHERLLSISRKYDMQPVSIPHIAKHALYETSGHADKFSEELFTVQSSYDEFALKPVNCPHHTQIYASRSRSYRDLPVRYMESTRQYRDEKPGEISGLTRVRAITVDDGHVFCRPDQIETEAGNIAEIIREFYTAIGLYGNHWVSLSVKDPHNSENCIGSEEDWRLAEESLSNISDTLGLDAVRQEGEAAIYGPKLDFMFEDALGREHQLCTIQLDFAMPKRFGLTYTDSEGRAQTPVLIHRAILGSYERFIAILIEHFAGNFPVWLAPIQVKVLSVNDDVSAYAEDIARRLEKANLRVETDFSAETVGKKIRAAETEKVPYMLVLGEAEQQNETLSVRAKGSKQTETMTVEEFLDSISEEKPEA